MNDHRPSDELLSAYLDGELTPDERERVERMLDEDADARQTVDELRALGEGLRTLPSYKLEGDFAQRVLRRAEREILSGRAQRDDSDAPRQPVRLANANEVTPRAPFNWRSLVWSGVTVAAAITLMFYYANRSDIDNPRPDADRVARNESEEESDQRSSDQKSNDWRSLRRDESRRGLSDTVSRDRRPADDSVRAKDVAGATAADHSGHEDNKGLSLDRGGDATQSDKFAEGTGQRALAAKNGVAEHAEGTLTYAARTALATSAVSRRLGVEEPWIVACDISPRAADGAAFAKLLARHRITLETGNNEGGQNEGRRSAVEIPPTGVADARAPVSQAADDAPHRAGADGQGSAEGQGRGGGLPGWQMVYVDATPEQILAMIDDLSQRHDEFLSVAFQQAPGLPGGDAMLREAVLNKGAIRAADEYNASKPNGKYRKESSVEADEPAPTPSRPNEKRVDEAKSDDARSDGAPSDGAKADHASPKRDDGAGTEDMSKSGRSKGGASKSGPSKNDNLEASRDGDAKTADFKNADSKKAVLKDDPADRSVKDDAPADRLRPDAAKPSKASKDKKSKDIEGLEVRSGNAQGSDDKSGESEEKENAKSYDADKSADAENALGAGALRRSRAQQLEFSRRFVNRQPSPGAAGNLPAPVADESLDRSPDKPRPTDTRKKAETSDRPSQRDTGDAADQVRLSGVNARLQTSDLSKRLADAGRIRVLFVLRVAPAEEATTAPAASADEKPAAKEHKADE